MEQSVDQAIKDLKQLFNEKGHRPEPRAYLLRAALLKSGKLSVMITLK
jgi:hypothetical protein